MPSLSEDGEGITSGEEAVKGTWKAAGVRSATRPKDKQSKLGKLWDWRTRWE